MPVNDNQIIISRAVHTLQKLPTFAGLRAEEYQAILTICDVSRYRSDEVIFEEHGESLAMYIVLSGAVEMRADHPGIIATMQPGDLFGEIGVICQAQRSASAIATADTMLLKISKERFDRLLGRHPAVAAKILRNVAGVLALRLIKTSQSHVLL
jgi:CRP-like cAMP-binding protein